MSDRKYSDPSVYDNSIDGDDDPSGSDGGYDRHGNFINPRAMTELVLLRQQLAELREAARAVVDSDNGYTGLVESIAALAALLEESK